MNTDETPNPESEPVSDMKAPEPAPEKPVVDPGALYRKKGDGGLHYSIQNYFENTKEYALLCGASGSVTTAAADTFLDEYEKV